MALFLSKCAAGQVPVQSLNDGRPGGLLYEFLTTASLAAGDIIDLGPLEAGIKPLNVHLITDDLDSNGTPTITLTVGILNAAKTDIGAGTYDSFIVASTVAQASGIAVATLPNAYLCGASTSTRRLGIKVVAGAASGVGAGKKIAVILTASAG